MMSAKQLLRLFLFGALVIGGGLTIGYTFRPGAWYQGLLKPAFNPPPWVFAPVWTILYAMVAIAGWRIFEQPHAGSRAKLWAAQLVLNFLWTPIFFGAHQIGLALIVVLLLLAAILALIAASWPQDRVTAWLLMPYAAWVAFASLLNGAIWHLN